MFWKEQSIHVIDFEGSPRYGVVEYGVVTLQGGLITQARTALCAPDTEMTAKEIALHGIRTKDTAGTPPFAEHRELFFTLRKTGVLCAHHASVENGFLKRTWPYPPLSDDFSQPSGNRIAGKDAAAATHRQSADWGPWLDTRALYAAIYPDLKSHSLGELIQTFALSEPLEQLAATHCPPNRRKAHCALFDALASALLLQHLGAEDGFEQLTLQWLIEHSAASARALDTRRQQELF